MITALPRRTHITLNHTPWWQAMLILLPILLGLLYALPNLYGEDPVIQICSRTGNVVDTQLQSEVEQLLRSQQLHPQALVLLKDSLLIYWPDIDSQRRANDLLNSTSTLNERIVTALNLLPAMPRWLAAIGARPMRLGFDLRGGIRFLLAVDSDIAINKRQKQLAESLRNTLKRQRIRYRQVRHCDNGTIVISFPEHHWQEEAKRVLTANYPEVLFKQTETTTSSATHSTTALSATFSEQQLRAISEQTVEHSLTILRKRIDELGIVDAILQRQGAGRIVVELPGIQDSARAKKLLGATATLEFRLVNQHVNHNSHSQLPLPADTEWHYHRNGSRHALFKRVALNGEHITDASVSLNQYGRAQVNVVLDRLGGQRLADVTKAAIGKSMATLLIEYRQQPPSDEATDKPVFKKHDEVINVAQIESQLSNHFCISGIGTITEARHLALLLRSGALTAPLQIVEERTIGPSLGQQNIHQGLQACALGLAVTMLFMVVYYRKFGAIAVLALLANLLLLIGSLSLLPGVTLTLPGIAGIVLIIGMAVDANVLIFERIKEELGLGRTIQQAINQGYRNAFSSIADANITTLITACILYAVGTGPIKGFAITLSIGLATSVFTSIVVTRALVNRLYGGKRIQTLSI